MSENCSAFITANLVWNSYVSTSPRVTSLPVGPSFQGDAPGHFCDYRSTLKGSVVKLGFLISSLFPLLLPHNCGDLKQIPWSRLRPLTWLWMSPRHPVVVLASPRRTRSAIPLCINENWSQDVAQDAQGGRDHGMQFLRRQYFRNWEILMMLLLEKEIWKNGSGRKPKMRGKVDNRKENLGTVFRFWWLQISEESQWFWLIFPTSPVI